MHRYLISQSSFFLGSSYGGNFAYVCSTCFLYLSLNIWCTVKKKKKKMTCLSICVVLTQVVHCTCWNDAGTQNHVVGCTTLLYLYQRTAALFRTPGYALIVSPVMVSFFVFSSFFLFWSLSAVLGKC